MSTEKVTRPGMVLKLPGLTARLPTVTSTSCVMPTSRARRTMSLAHTSASLRSASGTVPLWPSKPLTSTESVRWPEPPKTTPTGARAFSSTGPCSMCGSTYATQPRASGPEAALPERPWRCSSEPNVARGWLRAGVAQARAAASSPVATALPIMGGPKRLPSSLLQLTSSRCRSVTMPWSCRVRNSSKPASTP